MSWHRGSDRIPISHPPVNVRGRPRCSESTTPRVARRCTSAVEAYLYYIRFLACPFACHDTSTARGSLFYSRFLCLSISFAPDTLLFRNPGRESGWQSYFRFLLSTPHHHHPFPPPCSSLPRHIFAYLWGSYRVAHGMTFAHQC